MFDSTDIMFDKYQRKMGKVKKRDYEIYSEEFMTENRACLEEMLQYVNAREDRQLAAKEVATVLFDNVTRQLGKFGKLRRNTVIDLSIYMIYYLFPSILKLENESSTLLCDAIRDEWRIRSKNENYNYASYDEVYKGFKEKLFGFF